MRIYVYTCMHYTYTCTYTSYTGKTLSCPVYESFMLARRHEERASLRVSCDMIAGEYCVIQISDMGGLGSQLPFQQYNQLHAD